MSAYAYGETEADKKGQKSTQHRAARSIETSQPGKASHGLYTELCSLEGVFLFGFRGAPPSLSESLLLGKPVDSRGIPSFLRLAPPKAGPTFSPQDKSQENTAVTVTVLVSLVPCMVCIHPQKNPVK